MINTELEQRIIDTARRLFIQKGFNATSMSDIAIQVGINRPTLYYYFRTKERMFQAVSASLVAQMLPKINNILAEDMPFLERVRLILDHYMDMLIENPFIARFILGEVQRDVQHLLNEARELHLDQYIGQIAKIMERDMKEGKIRNVPTPIVFLTFYSSLLCPFLAKNLIVNLVLDDEQEFIPLMRQWKNYIYSQMCNLLEIK